MSDLPVTQAVSDPFAAFLSYSLFVGPPAPMKPVGVLSVSHKVDWDAEGWDD